MSMCLYDDDRDDGSWFMCELRFSGSGYAENNQDVETTADLLSILPLFFLPTVSTYDN